MRDSSVYQQHSVIDTTDPLHAYSRERMTKAAKYGMLLLMPSNKQHATDEHKDKKNLFFMPLLSAMAQNGMSRDSQADNEKQVPNIE